MAAVNKKEDQYIRLKMLVGLSTKVLRKKFDKLNPPDELQKKLDTFKSSITHRIHRKEYDKLYPPGGAPVTSDDMDLTALVRVLRNTDLVEPLSGFGCNPPDYDTSFGADVVRILLSRNKVNHVDFGNLQEQECKNMSQTLIEVIKRLSSSRIDDQIDRIMNNSLDYRDDSLIWHAQKMRALVHDRFQRFVYQPAKASVIQLNQQQPLYYPIIGGTVLNYGMQTLSKIQSLEELIYFLKEVRNITVRHCIIILNEYPYLKQKFKELSSGQNNQENSENDIKPVGLNTERNNTIPENIYFSNSTLNSDLHGLYSGCGHVNHTSMLFSNPSAVDLPYRNDIVLDDQFYIQFYTPRSCKYHPLFAYERQFERENSTNFSLSINVSGPKESTTKTERKSTGSDVENDIDSTRQIEQECEYPLSCQMSSNHPDSSWFQSNFSMKHVERGYESTSETLVTLCQTSTPCAARNQTNNHFNTSDPYVSQSDIDCCLTQEKKNEPEIEKENDALNVFVDFKKYLFWICVLCGACIITKIIYPNLCAIFKSESQAKFFTFMIVLYYFVLIFYFYIA